MTATKLMTGAMTEEQTETDAGRRTKAETGKLNEAAAAGELTTRQEWEELMSRLLQRMMMCR